MTRPRARVVVRTPGLESPEMARSPVRVGICRVPVVGAATVCGGLGRAWYLKGSQAFRRLVVETARLRCVEDADCFRRLTSTEGKRASGPDEIIPQSVDFRENTPDS